MRYRSLGDTGLEASEISLGTVELGLDYGFKGSNHYARPSAEDAIRLLHQALGLGVNLFDTARSYGESEAVIGRALKEWNGSKPILVTKVIIPKEAQSMELGTLRAEIHPLIETSLKTLGVDTLDVLLIHNAQRDHLKNPEILRCLTEAQQQGKVRFLGASCPADQDLCLELLAQPAFRALEVPFNLLDQKMRHRVFEGAAKSRVAIFVRSVYLRGLLTDRIFSAPERLDPLKHAATKVQQLAETASGSLPETAVRFCLSYPAVSSVLIGMKTPEELLANLAHAEKGTFSSELVALLESQSMENDSLVNTAKWQDLI